MIVPKLIYAYMKNVIDIIKKAIIKLSGKLFDHLISSRGFILNLAAYLVTNMASFNFIEQILSFSARIFYKNLSFFSFIQQNDPELVLLNSSPEILAGNVATRLFLDCCFFSFLQVARMLASSIEILILLKDRCQFQLHSPILFPGMCRWKVFFSQFISVFIFSLFFSLAYLRPNSGVCFQSPLLEHSSYSIDCIWSQEMVSSHNLKYSRSVMPLYSTLPCRSVFSADFS